MNADFETMRDAMVESQLRTVGVDDPRVIKAMANVPRETFVPAEKQRLAYADTLLGLGGGRALNLPMATGRLLTAMRLTGDEHVLVVGGATGYAAALCAELAKSVVMVEADADLIAKAREALAGYDTIEIVEGELAAGHAASVPYDAILVDGLVEHIPDALVEQLGDGGRLGAAVLEDGISRLTIGRKSGDAFGASAFAEAQAAVLPGFERPRAFVFQ